jgi:hypothetical protein
MDTPNIDFIEPERSQSGEETATQPLVTLGELYRAYTQELSQQENPHALACFKSALLRYVVPVLGGPSPEKLRMNRDEITFALEFLDQQPASILEGLYPQLQQHFKGLDLARKTQVTACSSINHWLKWAVQRGTLKVQQPEQPRIYKFKDFRKSRPYREEVKLIPGRPSRKNRNILGCFESDYIKVEDWDDEFDTSKICKSWKSEVLANPDVQLPVYLANLELDMDVRRFAKFLKHRMHLRPPTVEKDVGTLLRFLGWLHRQRQVPLADLRITTVIPFIKLTFKPSDFMGDSGLPDRKALREAKQCALEDLDAASGEIKEQVSEFLAAMKLSPAARVTYLTGIINIAKYVYQHETRTFRPTKSGFEDISLVKDLRSLRYEVSLAHVGKPKTVIPRESRLVSWLELLEVVTKLQTEADLTHRSHLRHTRPLQSGLPAVEKVKRTDWAIACCMQRFLILAIMTATPPGRPRDYRELELGRTLLQGVFRDGVFVPKEQMKDPTQAEWWIYLMPEDYRTGKCYGEWQGKLPDIRFANDKTLYQYIDEWLTRWRPIFQPSHQCLFTQHKGLPLNGNSFSNKVQTMIFRFTGVRVNPHSLRHAYVTYLKANAATEEELEGTAAFMRHSRKTQAKIYDQVDLQTKITPSVALAQSIAESFYSNQKVD